MIRNLPYPAFANLPHLTDAPPQQWIAWGLYLLMGVIAVPIGGIAEIVLVHGGLTPLVKMPPDPSIFHMFAVVILFFVLRCTLRCRIGGAAAMAAGFFVMALAEPTLQATFPHLWMRIYAMVEFLC